MTFEQGIALIIVAVIAAAGSIVAARWSAKNDRARINQELITVMGVERQKVSDDLEKVRIRAKEQDAQLEAVDKERRTLAEEFSLAKIAHREATSEKDATIREKNAKLTEIETLLNACRTELAAARAEIARAETLIRSQAQEIYQLRQLAQAGGVQPGTTP